MKTWTRIWTVRYDGTQLDPFEVCDAGGGSTVLVREPGAPSYVRYQRATYDARFDLTQDGAIAKFLTRAAREIVLATEELRAAQALLDRGLALTPNTEARH